MTGKHAALLAMLGATLPVTDHQVQFTGTSLGTLREDRMAEERVQTDWMGFMQQLGGAAERLTARQEPRVYGSSRAALRVE